jgi:hypothetical protein
MSRTLLWKIAAAGGLAATTLLLSMTAFASLSGVTTPINFAETHDQQAYDLLVKSSAPKALDAAGAQAERALELSPYDNSARLRLTYIDTVRRGALGGRGLARLAESYDLVALDYTVAAWRVRFGLEHWRELTPELRKAVEAEALAFSRAGSQDVAMASVLQSIRNPEGRLAAALWVQALARR